MPVNAVNSLLFDHLLVNPIVVVWLDYIHSLKHNEMLVAAQGVNLAGLFLLYYRMKFQIRGVCGESFSTNLAGRKHKDKRLNRADWQKG